MVKPDGKIVYTNNQLLTALSKTPDCKITEMYCLEVPFVEWLLNQQKLYNIISRLSLIKTTYYKCSKHTHIRTHDFGGQADRVLV